MKRREPHTCTPAPGVLVCRQLRYRREHRGPMCEQCPALDGLAPGPSLAAWEMVQRGAPRYTDWPGIVHIDIMCKTLPPEQVRFERLAEDGGIAEIRDGARGVFRRGHRLIARIAECSSRARM